MMLRQRVLKVVLVLVGLLFTAAIYPAVGDLWRMTHPEYGYGEDMGLSLYFALGIFLLLALRSPATNRSLILFAGWSSFAHAAVMARLAIKIARGEWVAVALLLSIGIALIALAPPKQSGERTEVAAA